MDGKGDRRHFISSRGRQIGGGEYVGIAGEGQAIIDWD
jgi:hypothetical protein